ncbi:S-layer-related duplication domain protein [Methanosalsum zhilinae DSM 4017]|uniref:S-layer-related duplication domain protein n=1 Tax=Methanosalsum zhilinae (strain DSM 4017 / NBRC 107636 / OCM 62 / WeN5) TaxID=679901 RepID=F7XNB3_METZD|nr:S-layer protein domain-containing protein [Methanosalsum zhilinae]AEH60073.1 S-layer-related duplication domain protein [Methanosalsum zhilinae DSM 4017]
MKKIAITLVALMLMSLFVAGFANADNDYLEELEIRGPAWNLTGADANEIFVANATNFAGFWYDIDDDESSEELWIYKNRTTARTLGDDPSAVEYISTVVPGIKPEFDFRDPDNASELFTYEKIGFLAEEYVPIAQGQTDKLSKLLMDSDTRYTLRTGQTLELADGYAITPLQIDVDGNKVWLELTKDGEFLDDKIIDVRSATGAQASQAKQDRTWYYEQDIMDEDDILTLMVHVEQVFQGTVDSLVVIEGIWQIEDDGLELETGDRFGRMEIDDVGDNVIRMALDTTITLRRDSTQHLMQDLYFRVADDAANIRFYLMQRITEPGTYEVRGTVANVTATEWFNWTATGFDVAGLEGMVTEGYSFAGFWYDLDEDLHSELLAVHVDDRTLRADDDEVVYYSRIQEGLDPEFDFRDPDNATEPFKYEKIGFLADEYVPIIPGQTDKLSKLLMDSDTRYTLRTGQTLELADGYAITPLQIDVDGNKVWLELTKDGDFLDDKIIDVRSATGAQASQAKQDRTWYYEQDIMDEDDVLTLIVHVEQVFQGTIDSLVVIEGIWQIEDDGLELETGDRFGRMEVDAVGDDEIRMTLDSNINLRRDSTQHVMGNIYFKVADSPDIRFYPFVERTVGEPVVPVDEEPVAAFTANPTRGVAPLTVTFTDQSEYAVNYLWDFGDGTTSTDPSPTHTYEEIGTYTVTLTVTNDVGEDSAERTITVTEEEILEPVAAFTAQPQEGEAPLTVTFTDQSEHAVSYQWDFGDGTTSTDASPTHTYEEAGEYTVTLTVENEIGETDSAQRTITVQEPEPTPGFEIVFAIAGILAVAFLVKRYRK